MIQPAGGPVRLGLVAAPEIPQKIAEQLTTELPALLSRRVSNRVSWNVSAVCDSLMGSEKDAPEILGACHARMLEEGWDLAVCLTDLPVYRSGRLVAADVSAACGVGAISLPSMGVVRLRSRAREATLQLEDPNNGPSQV